ncbi:MAG: hypothetical protein DRP83_03505 [Planctomycetota bacterium]|nr:MAG: hypothetical protein DRP83_03505 [Planctomycetota bacterium]
MTFATPILLVGLAAAALPLVLHLVSRVRARQEEFPTLRFLRISLVKTARRRKVRNWFLLLLRSLLLAVLALAVAEPLSRATGWFASEGQAVAIVLDDSYSQATASAENKNSPSRFARARADIESLLGGKDKPALASLLKTCDTHPPKPLTAQLDAIRKTLAQARTQPGLSSLARSVAQAIELLEKQSNPQHAIYIFSDLQKLSFDPLTKLDALARAKDIPIFIVDSSQGVVDNVGITSLETQGDAIVDGQVKFVATLRNSSPRPKRAEVLFSVFNKSKPSDSKAEVQARAVRNLAPAGEPGDVVKVVFEHKFGTAGLVSGQVSLSRSDDLLVDNIRKFRLAVRPRSRALIVSNSQNGQGSISPGDVLALALDWRDEQHRDKPWPIHVARLEATKFSPESFKNIDAAFFCDVPTFTDAQARAMGQFVSRGGAAVFFLGPNVQPANYNRLLGRAGAGLLPGPLGQAIGLVGPEAPAQIVEKMDIAHPLLAGLFDSLSEYPAVWVQRYFPLRDPEKLPPSWQVLMQLPAGQPLLLQREVQAGRVLWCLTSAAPKWSSLPLASIFPPMMIRQTLRANATRPDQPASPGPANPFGPESNLAACPPEQLLAALHKQGLSKVFIGPSLSDVRAMASEESRGRNWWDVLIAAVILLLVLEAVLANRRVEEHKDKK